MSEVKSLFGGPCYVKQPDTAVVDMARDLLARAEAGEVVGLAYAMLYYDNTAGFAMAGLTQGYSLVGALEDAKLHALGAK